MPKRLPRPSPAFVIAVTSLFVALSGASYAAVKANSIGAKQIKPNAVATSELKDGTIGPADVADGAITGADIADDSVRSQDVSGIGSGDITDESLGSGDVAGLGGGDVTDESLGSADVDGLGADDITDGALGAAEIADDSLGSADVAGLQASDLASGQTVTAFARVGADGALVAQAGKVQGVDPADVQHEDTAATETPETTTGIGVYCFGGLGFEPRSAVVTLDNTDTLPAIGSLTGGQLNFIPSVAIFKGEDLGRCNSSHGQVRVAIERVNDTSAPILANHGFYIQLTG